MFGGNALNPRMPNAFSVGSYCDHRRLWIKSGKSDLFSLRPLRISAALCVERPINAEIAEIRRGPQRKDFHLNSIFCAKPSSSPGLSLRSNPGLKLANAFGVFCLQIHQLSIVSTRRR